jgi:hypothetical protein
MFEAELGGRMAEEDMGSGEIGADGSCGGGTDSTSRCAAERCSSRKDWREGSSKGTVEKSTGEREVRASGRDGVAILTRPGLSGGGRDER